MPRTVLFDVNETLSDTTPLQGVFASIGAAGITPAMWLAATLRDGFALSLTTGAKPFAEVAETVLAGLLSNEPNLSTPVSAGVRQVMTVFATLPVHDDVVAGLHHLRDQGHRLVTFSNGSTEYSLALLQRAGAEDTVDSVLSVDDAGVWKPHPRAYEHTLTTIGTSPEETVLVAAHPWDLHGARAAGLTTVHLNRARTAWPSTFAEPDIRIDALTDLNLS